MCNISNHIAISAIRVQSPQSECNLSNQTAILLHCSLIVEIAVRLWRLQSDCKDCCQILEIEVWLCRLLSVCEDCSLIVEIAIWNEWNERFLNERLMSWIFQILSSQPIRGLNFGLSTNGKPLFQVLLFWLTSKIRLPSQQSDCNPAALQLEYRDWFGSQNRIAILYHATSLTRGGMTNRICKLRKLCNLSNPTAISAIQLQSQQSDCNPPELQLDYTDWFELQNRTAILYHATSPTRGGMTNRICKLKNICNLSNPTAISAIRLQSSWIAVRLHRLIWIAKQNCNPISRNLPDTR